MDSIEERLRQQLREVRSGDREAVDPLEILRACEEIDRLRHLLWTPENHDFVAGVMREAGHQVERWGELHDAQKDPLEWGGVVSFLFQKAVRSWMDGDFEKAMHHCISTAAVCANAHKHLSWSDIAAQEKGKSEESS